MITCSPGSMLMGRPAGQLTARSRPLTQKACLRGRRRVGAGCMHVDSAAGVVSVVSVDGMSSQLIPVWRQDLGGTWAMCFALPSAMVKEWKQTDVIHLCCLGQSLVWGVPV